jgi:subtilase family serine protease
VTLGTSVGWSDVYPSTYHENWIELDKVRENGCYAFVHIADPKNGIFELNEGNNEASTVVYLTKRGKYRPGRCGGVDDEALAPSQTANDLEVPGDSGGY